MKLEPGRTSLSGRPEFLKPAPVQTPAPVQVQRSCCACGLKDVTHLVEDHPEHSVTIELRFLKAENEPQARKLVTPYLASRGWRYKFHLGRHAMERDICRPCMLAHNELEQEFRRKRTNELKSNLQNDSYFTAICGENL